MAPRCSTRTEIGYFLPDIFRFVLGKRFPTMFSCALPSGTNLTWLNATHGQRNRQSLRSVAMTHAIFRI